jgi:hypothetical protein
MHAPYRGHRIIPANAAPLDGFAAPSGAYSFRKLRSGYAGSALRLRRASDNLETDINFLGCTSFTGCPWDEAAALAHCASTTCFVRTWYDQSGGTLDLVNTTAATQPQLVFNCKGTLPCLQISSAALLTLNTTATPAPATGVASIAAVGVRTAGTTSCTLLRQDGGAGNRLHMPAVNTWGAYGSAGGVTRAAVDGTWHSGIGIWNGAASSLTIDGGTTAGTLTAATAAGAVGLAGAASTTCNEAEAILWDNYILTGAEIGVLGANQKSFWGTP